jgi:hypothetical protein
MYSTTHTPHTSCKLDIAHRTRQQQRGVRPTQLRASLASPRCCWTHSSIFANTINKSQAAHRTRRQQRVIRTTQLRASLAIPRRCCWHARHHHSLLRRGPTTLQTQTPAPQLLTARGDSSAVSTAQPQPHISTPALHHMHLSCSRHGERAALLQAPAALSQPGHPEMMMLARQAPPRPAALLAGTRTPKLLTAQGDEPQTRTNNNLESTPQ